MGSSRQACLFSSHLPQLSRRVHVVQHKPSKFVFTAHYEQKWSSVSLTSPLAATPQDVSPWRQVGYLCLCCTEAGRHCSKKCKMADFKLFVSRHHATQNKSLDQFAISKVNTCTRCIGILHCYKLLICNKNAHYQNTSTVQPHAACRKSLTLSKFKLLVQARGFLTQMLKEAAAVIADNLVQNLDELVLQFASCILGAVPYSRILCITAISTTFCHS